MKKLLQCGYPKSGNYLLWRILCSCQKELGIYSNFSIKSGISDITKKIYTTLDLQPIVSENFEIDRIEEQQSKFFFYKDIREDKNWTRYFKTDLNLLFSVSSLVWTHSLPESLLQQQILDKFNRAFYILRDGRSVINSLIHHVTRKEILLLQPCYNYKSIEEVYNDLDLFSKYVLMWKNHVISFLENRQKFILVRFENLTVSKLDLKKILSLFGLSDHLIEYERKFSFDNMKKQEPGHVRKGDNKDWENFFNKKHKEIFKDIAGELLVELRYAKNRNW